MTLIFFAEFPFDGICKDPKHRQIEWWRYRDAKAMYNVTTDNLYQPCEQAVTGRVLSLLFGGSVVREGMSGKQERTVRLFAGLVVALTFILFIIFFGQGVVMGIYHLFHGSYEPETDANEAHFTDCDIQAYIPMITHPSLAYPLICADVKQFEGKYLPFELENEEEYLTQSLFNKNELPQYTETELRELFSEVKYYPPPEGLQEIPDEDADGGGWNGFSIPKFSMPSANKSSNQSESSYSKVSGEDDEEESGSQA
eukprot:CAMPEP_0114393650 /NCGR_PEP_ID=MMETSP0102-20121206/11659_1 /TAXON_ID=38822 ORGANISM="Pteridomonas danica, Strain PT" /NCGR_SAMPLE_ID=MMETSP0102 /ASSEMBLY_ACC=CAM_ASM_000212 /LENGTH=254 /DNA_ID=CAMNT_0001553339 /DNA_START=897 /DNA_END=1661 /DNA_ORIENTATION=+